MTRTRSKLVLVLVSLILLEGAGACAVPPSEASPAPTSACTARHKLPSPAPASPGPAVWRPFNDKFRVGENFTFDLGNSKKAWIAQNITPGAHITLSQSGTCGEVRIISHGSHPGIEGINALEAELAQWLKANPKYGNGQAAKHEQMYYARSLMVGVGRSDATAAALRFQPDAHGVNIIATALMRGDTIVFIIATSRDTGINYEDDELTVDALGALTT